MSERMEKIEKTDPVAGDIDEIEGDLLPEEDADLPEEEYDESDEYDEDEDLDGYDEEGDGFDPFRPRESRLARIFSRKNVPVVLIWARYLFPLLSCVILFALSFGDLFEFYQSSTVGTISIFGLYGATFQTVFSAFGEITSGTVLWYAILQLLGAIIGLLAFLLFIGFAILAAITACRAFCHGPEDPTANRMKVIFKVVFPNRICLFLANALALVPFLFPYYFSFVLERFYNMGVEPEMPIYIKSNPCFWIALGLTVITLVLALVIPRYERRRRMNMFLVEHKETEEAAQ